MANLTTNASFLSFPISIIILVLSQWTSRWAHKNLTEIGGTNKRVASTQSHSHTIDKNYARLSVTMPVFYACVLDQQLPPPAARTFCANWFLWTIVLCFVFFLLLCNMEIVHCDDARIKSIRAQENVFESHLMEYIEPGCLKSYTFR